MPYVSMLAEVAGSWWTFLLRGIAAVLFAIAAFVWPGLTLTVLVLFWGAFALVDGVVAIAAGARARWWSVLFLGVIGVLAGLVALFMPGITALALVLVIASWAVLRGILEIAAAMRLRRELTGEWLLVLGGAASVVLGILMFLFPGAGALAVVWLIGLQALIAGIVLIALAFRLRGLRTDHRLRVDLGGATPPGPGVQA